MSNIVRDFEAGRVSRREFLKYIGVTGTAAAGAAVSLHRSIARADDELEETDTVIVGVYSGDWETNIEKAALDQFADDTGIDVVVVPGADAEWITKVQAANGRNVPYDLLILQPDGIQKLVEADLLQPLTDETVPNLAKQYGSIRERFTWDDGIYAAGFSMGQLGIAYRKDLVETVPGSWEDLWNEEYAGQIAVSPLTYSAGLQFFWALTDEGKDIDGAFDKLAELKPSIAAYPDGAGTIQTLLQRGDVAIVPFWDGRVFAWEDEGEPIGFVYPSDGPVAAIASWAIPAGAPNLANAYKLLDFLSSAEVQTAFAPLSGYGMSNIDTEYSEEFLAKAAIGEEFYNQLEWIDYALATPNLAEWSNRWQEVLG